MQPLEDYFAGERTAGLLATALGVASLTFAAWLFRSASPFRAMLYPLAIIGAIELAIGIGLNVRTAPQVARLEEGFVSQPDGTRKVETARMEKVQRNFKIIEVAEVVLIAVGILLIFAVESASVRGVGMGLVVQAATLLAFDVFAEQRGSVYLAWLKRD